MTIRLKLRTFNFQIMRYPLKKIVYNLVQNNYETYSFLSEKFD